jgi:hypothetical protein
VPGDGVCDGSVMHVHVARTSARDLPGAELSRCNGHLEQDLTRFCRWLSDPDGSHVQSVAYSATVILFLWST